MLQIGLQNGVLLRTTIDSVTGEISDTRTRYLGTKAVKLFKVMTEGENSVLAVSSRSWLSYRHQQRFHLTPLSYEALDSATGFRYFFIYFILISKNLKIKNFLRLKIVLTIKASLLL